RHPRRGGAGQTPGRGTEGVQPVVGRRGGVTREGGGAAEIATVSNDGRTPGNAGGIEGVCTMNDNDLSSADPFGQIADEFVEAFRQGKRPSVEEFAPPATRSSTSPSAQTAGRS